MPEKLPETIVFDLDGTLIDTAPDLASALNAVLTEERLPHVSLDEVRHMVGRGARVLIERAMAAHGVTLTERRTEELMQHFLVHYEANIAATSTPFDGMVGEVEALTAKGHRIGICTNKPEYLSHKLLAELRLAKLFPVVLGADSRPYRKPDPRHLILASAHPSPLSARRGFFGSRPFSRINGWLSARGLAEIDWQLR